MSSPRAGRPALLIADELTDRLDAETGLAVVQPLRAVVRSVGVTALAGTHDPQPLGSPTGFRSSATGTSSNRCGPDFRMCFQGAGPHQNPVNTDPMPAPDPVCRKFSG